MRPIYFTLWLLLACGGLLDSRGAAVLDGPMSRAGEDRKVTITWTTDVVTGTRVAYGRTLERLNQRAAGEQGTNHFVVLSGLEPGAKYVYTIGTARAALATNSFIAPGQSLGTNPVASAPAQEPGKSGRASEASRPAPPARQTWGHFASLQDHFERHGRDFNAKDPEDYARLAWEFLQRARSEGLPMKVDDDGVFRVFDPKTRTFGAYNRDGTTKTFFKPQSRDYFERQPGEPVKPKNRK